MGIVLLGLQRKMPPEGLAGTPHRDAAWRDDRASLRHFDGACNRIETIAGWASRCRSTPELAQLQAHLSALMTYRVASGVLQHLLPIDAGRSLRPCAIIRCGSARSLELQPLTSQQLRQH